MFHLKLPWNKVKLAELINRIYLNTRVQSQRLQKSGNLSSCFQFASSEAIPRSKLPLNVWEEANWATSTANYKSDPVSCTFIKVITEFCHTDSWWWALMV